MKALDTALKNPVGLALGAALVIGVVYLIARKTAADAVAGVGGIATGNNAITRGTPYAGAGVAGTLGAAVDATSGGIFSDLGSAVGGWFYDVTHDEYDPNTGLQTASKTVSTGAANTDSVWGRIGGVLLRAN